MGRARNRIDGRPQSSWATQAGLRGTHRNMRGDVIGGYTQDGQGYGTKAEQGSTNGSSGWQNRLTGSGEGGGTNPATGNRGGGGTAPATGNILNARKNLFEQMGVAGSEALTPAMRAKARSLGVTDEDFNSAAGRLKANEAITPRQPGNTPPATQPGNTPPATQPAPASGSDGWPQNTSPEAIAVFEGNGPATQPATQPVSKIDGMPATTALKNIEAGKNSNGTNVNPEFGADIAKHNIATKGIQGAVKDYYQRREDYKPNIERPTWQQKFDKAAAPVDQPSMTAAPNPRVQPTGQRQFKPMWNDAIRIPKPNNSPITKPKTGGLEGTLATIDKSRAETQDLFKPRK